MDIYDVKAGDHFLIDKNVYFKLAQNEELIQRGNAVCIKHKYMKTPYATEVSGDVCLCDKDGNPIIERIKANEVKFGEWFSNLSKTDFFMRVVGGVISFSKENESVAVNLLTDFMVNGEYHNNYIKAEKPDWVSL